MKRHHKHSIHSIHSIHSVCSNEGERRHDSLLEEVIQRLTKYNAEYYTKVLYHYKGYDGEIDILRYKDNKVYAVYEIKATHGYKQYKHSKEQLHRAKMLYTDAYLIYVARSHHEIVAKIVR